MNNNVLEQAIEIMRKTVLAKQQDYASETWDSNFAFVAESLGLEGYGVQESILSLILVKIARLKSLRLNGKMDSPNNESVQDTLLDLMNYSMLLYASTLEKQQPQS